MTAGAVALLVERFVDLAVPQLKVPSVRQVLGRVSAAIFGWPSRRLRMAGITGTNGKTTTSYLLETCLAEQGRQTGMIGTVETKLAGQRLPASATTPEAPDLHAALAAMVQSGVEDVVMEVSSHALDQGRVDGIRYEVAVFTNLTPEHLDYHGTVEHYWASKARLFEPERCRQAVICVDDEWGRRLAAQVKVPVVTYGTAQGSDFRISAVATERDGTWLEVREGAVSQELHVPYPGRVNAANATAAYVAARCLGVGREDAVAALAKAPPVPGRFQVVDRAHPVSVVVDYAHTPEALGALVATARELAGKGRVIVVAGATGERDRFKRPELAREAARADLVVFTDESPGEEDPASIVAELRCGTFGVGVDVEVELDRAHAINLAISRALPGDIVLIVGRGHERSFRHGNMIIPLDDRAAAREALKRWPNGLGEPGEPSSGERDVQPLAEKGESGLSTTGAAVALRWPPSNRSR